MEAMVNMDSEMVGSTLEPNTSFAENLSLIHI